jgi:predicted metal-dependent hydrolase
MTWSDTHAPIRPRAPGFVFGDDIPRFWLLGSPTATHLLNGINLLFPLGERFFVRSVRHYQDRIDDPQLRADIRGFMAQEVRHGLEHERYFERLRAQGYDIDRFLEIYAAIAFGIVERVSPAALNLAITAALEHFTAALAERAFTTDFFDHAHPVMAELLRWHAAEEIEHKSVAFDVLASVAPGWPLRAAGIAVGAGMLAAFWIAAVQMLLAQDRRAGRLVREPELPPQDPDEALPRVLGRALVAYLRPGFHPREHADRALADAFFARWSRRAQAA